MAARSNFAFSIALHKKTSFFTLGKFLMIIFLEWNWKTYKIYREKFQRLKKKKNKRLKI